jgi:hypothetical protein
LVWKNLRSYGVYLAYRMNEISFNDIGEYVSNFEDISVKVSDKTGIICLHSAKKSFNSLPRSTPNNQLFIYTLLYNFINNDRFLDTWCTYNTLRFIIKCSSCNCVWFFVTHFEILLWLYLLFQRMCYSVAPHVSVGTARNFVRGD